MTAKDRFVVMFWNVIKLRAEDYISQATFLSVFDKLYKVQSLIGKRPVSKQEWKAELVPDFKFFQSKEIKSDDKQRIQKKYEKYLKVQGFDYAGNKDNMHKFYAETVYRLFPTEEKYMKYSLDKARKEGISVYESNNITGGIKSYYQNYILKYAGVKA